MDRKMNWILHLPSLQGTWSHSPLTLAEIFILRIAEGMTEVYFRKVVKALGTWSRCVYFFSGRYRRYVQLGQKVKQNSVHISMPKLWYSKNGRRLGAGSDLPVQVVWPSLPGPFAHLEVEPQCLSFATTAHICKRGRGIIWVRFYNFFNVSLFQSRKWNSYLPAWSLEGTNGNCGDLLVTSGFLTLAKDGPHFQVLRLFLLRSWTCVGISVRHSTHVDGPRMFSFSDFLTASCTDFVKYFFFLSLMAFKLFSVENSMSSVLLR